MAEGNIQKDFFVKEYTLTPAPNVGVTPFTHYAWTSYNEPGYEIVSIFPEETNSSDVMSFGISINGNRNVINVYAMMDSEVTIRVLFAKV